jgi:thymidylate kinase
MVGKLGRLVGELDSRGIGYCHWKSNFALQDTVEGRTDVDLLVRRSDAGAFKSVLIALGFRPAINTDGKSFLSVEHYYGLDEESGTLIHVHAYLRVITGESLAKNYHLPVEEMLLRNTREVNSIRVPTKGAELMVFTLRMMLKHTSLVELALLTREWRRVREEAHWLTDPVSINESLSLLECWLPSMDPSLFTACTKALTNPPSIVRRVLLARRVRARLRVYARNSTLRARLLGVRKFIRMLSRRLRGGQRAMVPLSGGAVIGFVGPEASGKSTLLSEIRAWLGEHFAVDRIHAGKPPSTAISAIPNLLLPTLRSLLPGSRSTRVEMDYAPNNPKEGKRTYPLLFAVRSVLLAYDRRVLLARAFGRAANGEIVLCDRYPSLMSGAPDSPQLRRLTDQRSGFPVRRFLARFEERLYREIPPADLIIYLNVPLEVALSRNRSRSKYEPEDYVRRRHAQSSNLAFGQTPVYNVNTDQPVAETLMEVEKSIWTAL